MPKYRAGVSLSGYVTREFEALDDDEARAIAGDIMKDVEECTYICVDGTDMNLHASLNLYQDEYEGNSIKCWRFVMSEGDDE